MSADMQIEAKDVAEAVLSITGDALLSGDFDGFRSVFHVPQQMATIGGPINVETVEDLRRGFDEVVRHFRAIGVTDMVRSVVAATYKTPTLIESTHVCDLLHDGKRLKDTYPVFSKLEKIDGTWKVVASEYALEPNNGQAIALSRADAAHRPDQSLNQ